MWRSAKDDTDTPRGSSCAATTWSGTGLILQRVASVARSGPAGPAVAARIRATWRSWPRRLLRRRDYPDGRFTLAFVGYGEESEVAVLELTHNWDTASYELGTGYGHVALEVEDAAAACASIRARGGKVVREAGPMKHGTTVIAFVEDPDGYKVELIERKA